MENIILLNSLKERFFEPFSMLERIIENCPDDLWNKKVSGFVFWQQILHTLVGEHFWLREEKTEFIEPFKDKNVYPEFEKDPENVLSKDELKLFCAETKEFAEKWFSGKDDNWLKLPSKIYDKWTNLDTIVGQIGHLMYHVGHCDAIFRENNLKGVWN
jgi:hypothetical protein